MAPKGKPQRKQNKPGRAVRLAQYPLRQKDAEFIAKFGVSDAGAIRSAVNVLIQLDKHFQAYRKGALGRD